MSKWMVIVLMIGVVVGMILTNSELANPFSAKIQYERGQIENAQLKTQTQIDIEQYRKKTEAETNAYIQSKRAQQEEQQQQAQQALAQQALDANSARKLSESWTLLVQEITRGILYAVILVGSLSILMTVYFRLSLQKTQIAETAIRLEERQRARLREKARETELNARRNSKNRPADAGPESITTPHGPRPFPGKIQHPTLQTPEDNRLRLN